MRQEQRNDALTIQAIAVVTGLVSLALPFIPPLFMLYPSKGN